MEQYTSKETNKMRGQRVAAVTLKKLIGKQKVSFLWGKSCGLIKVCVLIMLMDLR